MQTLSRALPSLEVHAVPYPLSLSRSPRATFPLHSPPVANPRPANPQPARRRHHRRRTPTPDTVYEDSPADLPYQGDVEMVPGDEPLLGITRPVKKRSTMGGRAKTTLTPVSRVVCIYVCLCLSFIVERQAVILAIRQKSQRRYVTPPRVNKYRPLIPTSLSLSLSLSLPLSQ